MRGAGALHGYPRAALREDLGRPRALLVRHAESRRACERGREDGCEKARHGCATGGARALGRGAAPRVVGGQTQD